MAPPRKYDDGNPPVQTCPQCGNQFHRKIRKRVGKGHGGGLQPQTYCSRTCSNFARGAKGFYIDKHGYKILNNGKRGGYKQPEHHAVMEKIIGRPVLLGETVHHVNGKRDDNRPENLELWSSRHGKGQRTIDLWPLNGPALFNLCHN